MNEESNNANRTAQRVAQPQHAPSGKRNTDRTPAVTPRHDAADEIDTGKAPTGMERAKDAAANVASSMADAASYVGHKAQDVTVSVGVALESTGQFLKEKLESSPMIENLRDLYLCELKDLYSAEQQLLKAMPKLISEATSITLKKALEHHLGQTRGHVARLEQIFKETGVAASGKRCRAMEGIILEADELLADYMPPPVKDAAIIASVQRAEHYEMAGYGCVRTYARLLGEHSAASLLNEILQEEGAADVALSSIAEGSINQEAMAAV